MADEELQDLESGAKKAAPGSGKNPLLTILVLVNTIAMFGVAFFQYQMHQKISSVPSVQDVVTAEMKKLEDGEAREETGEAVEEDGLLLPLEGFTANLAQGDGPRRFVRLTAVLKFSKESNEDEFKARMPQIRDTIISTLNSKRPADLLKLEGKNFLKEELKSAINSFLVDGHIIDIFYVGFQIN
jgi:flagellar FliL protein